MLYSLVTPACPDILVINNQMTPDQITGCYLLQVQSWYGKANRGEPISSEIQDLIDSGEPYQIVSLAALDEILPYGCDGVHICQWGNYGFDDAEYSDILNERSFDYCHLVRDFTEGDGRPDADPFHTFEANVPTDTWNDVIFILVSSDTDTSPSIYLYQVDPPWLRARDGSNLVRNSVTNRPEPCPTSGN